MKNALDKLQKRQAEIDQELQELTVKVQLAKAEMVDYVVEGKSTQGLSDQVNRFEQRIEVLTLAKGRLVDQVRAEKDRLYQEEVDQARKDLERLEDQTVDLFNKALTDLAKAVGSFEEFGSASRRAIDLENRYNLRFINRGLVSYYNLFRGGLFEFANLLKRTKPELYNQVGLGQFRPFIPGQSPTYQPVIGERPAEQTVWYEDPVTPGVMHQKERPF